LLVLNKDPLGPTSAGLNAVIFGGENESYYSPKRFYPTKDLDNFETYSCFETGERCPI
jgi:hypothetical protein